MNKKTRFDPSWILCVLIFVLLGLTIINDKIKISDLEEYSLDITEKYIDCVNKDVPSYYCTTLEYKELLTTLEPVCGFAEDSSEKYGGLVKIDGRWINEYWLEQIEGIFVFNMSWEFQDK